MDLDPRNYDLGELRGPPAKRDSDTDGIKADEDSQETTGSVRDAREEAPIPPRGDGRTESSDRTRSKHGNAESTDPGERPPHRNGDSTPANPPSPTGAGRARVVTERAATDRYRRLVAIERIFESDPEKPYLTTLPTAFSDELVIFEWLDSLLGHTGHRNTVEALRYYREIGWITEGVETSLRGYLRGPDRESLRRDRRLVTVSTIGSHRSRPTVTRPIS